jgi:4-hydroxybenzoate polyprenyltransferase
MTTAAARTPFHALRLIAADIKLAHSVFALPFAVLAAFLAGPARGAPASAWTAFGGQLALVVVCMVLARTWAMLVNRLLDRRLDAANARTAGRVFAARALSPAVGWLVAALCAALFLAAAALFQRFYANPWPLYLALPVLAWLAFYSFTKRFTALCHAVLGVSLALSPIAAAIAVRPGALAWTPTIWWLAAFVVLWVGGFDVIYALQDEDYDRTAGLSSVPVALGTSGAVWVARGAHLLASVALLAAWTSDRRLSWLFGAGLAAAITLLAVEHAVLARTSLAGSRPGLHAVFFTLNGVVAIILGACGVIDVVLP